MAVASPTKNIQKLFNQNWRDTMKQIKRYGSLIALFLMAILAMAVPIAAREHQGLGLGIGVRASAAAQADTDAATTDIGVPADTAVSADVSGMPRIGARRPFAMPIGIKNAQCVHACIESTARASSSGTVSDDQRRQCMEKCNAEKKAEKEQRKEQRDEKKAWHGNFSGAVRAITGQQKIIREDFKDFRKSMKNETSNETSDEKPSMTDEEKAKLQEAKKAMLDQIDNLREKKQELFESIPAAFKTPRLIARGEMMQLNHALGRTQQDYADAKKLHVESRARIEAQKKAYHVCMQNTKSAVNDADATRSAEAQVDFSHCKEIKKEFSGDVKTFLLKTADMVVESLNKLKYQVKLSEDITDEASVTLVAEIEQRIIDVKNARVTVEELKDEADSVQLKAAAKTIRDAWQETRVLFKKDVGVLMQAKLGNIINRMDQLKEKFSKARDLLKGKGADVSSLDDMLGSFDAKLSTARADYEQAVTLFAQAQSAKNADSVVKQAHELVKQARTDLKSAQEELRKLTAELKVQLRATAETEAAASAQPASSEARESTVSADVNAQAEASAEVSASSD
ncbi:MAG: hypothetical protein Q7R76_02840 [Candidatus Woesearchaeota archaeon]|nr:hypothetical protein [Candidatus Woesearchaeota archaeon]